MKNAKKQNQTPWKTPQITTLSISRDTKQDGPIDPPDAGSQS